MQCFIFLSDDSKQDDATTNAHSKRLITFLKDKKVLTTSFIIILKNTYGCAEQYRCAYALYLMSVMSQCYFIIIDWGISAPGDGKEVVYWLNYVHKRSIYQLMSTVQLPGSSIFDSQLKMHTGNQKYDVILAKEFQHHLTKEQSKNGVFDRGKNKENVQTDSIMFGIILMLRTKMLECIVTQINSYHYHFMVHIPNLVSQGVWVSIVIFIFIQN